MSLILSGTDGLSDVDGSAATPAIRGTDANTGIFFPAADTIAFAEGGVESMRISSAGNVGIGTTAPSGPLNVVSAASSLAIAINGRSSDGLGAMYFYANNGSTQYATITTSATEFRHSSVPAAAVQTFYTNSAERLRIDSSGNVGIGFTSPGNRLYVSKNDNTYYLTDFENSFASGNGYVNRMYFSGSAPNNTSSIFSAMVDNAANRCIIYANGGIHNYQANNSNLSDSREKTNFAPAGEYLLKICAIPVQTFNYIDQNLEEDGGLTLGVIAQDVQAVAPELVSESDWSPEKDGSKMRLSIYQTDLQYALMKCIQEQQALITDLTARITALETAP
jgi:hypothetical protein